MRGVRLPLSHRSKLFNYNAVTDQIKPVFFGWLMQCLKGRSQKNTSQLFYISLLNEWRGLSVKGMDPAGKMGTMLASRTYRRHKNLALRVQARQVEGIIRQTSCIFWFDNFNKFFRRFVLAIPIGPYQQVSWTPLAITKLPGTSARNLSHVNRADGSLKSAYPSIVFTRRTVTELMDFFEQFNDFLPAQFWQTSVATVNQVFTTPLRLPIQHTQDELRFGSETGLKYFQPVDLVPHNVQTKQGLCDMLRFVRLNHWSPGHYMLLKLDVDLYWRVAKVTIFYLFSFQKERKKKKSLIVITNFGSTLS